MGILAAVAMICLGLSNYETLVRWDRQYDTNFQKGFSAFLSFLALSAISAMLASFANNCLLSGKDNSKIGQMARGAYTFKGTKQASLLWTQEEWTFGKPVLLIHIVLGLLLLRLRRRSHRSCSRSTADFMCYPGDEDNIFRL